MDYVLPTPEKSVCLKGKKKAALFGTFPGVITNTLITYQI